MDQSDHLTGISFWTLFQINKQLFQIKNNKFETVAKMTDMKRRLEAFESFDGCKREAGEEVVKFLARWEASWSKCKQTGTKQRQKIKDNKLKDKRQKTKNKRRKQRQKTKKKHRPRARQRHPGQNASFSSSDKDKDPPMRYPHSHQLPILSPIIPHHLINHQHHQDLLHSQFVLVFRSSDRRGGGRIEAGAEHGFA